MSVRNFKETHRSPATWRMVDVDGVRIIRCIPLEGIDRVVHAFSTRIGDRSDSFDMGEAGTGDAAVLARRRMFLSSSGFAGSGITLPLQVHGARLVFNEPGGRVVEADGVLARAGENPGIAAGVRTADCVPVLLADRMGRFAAAIHAGWRGTAARISALAVERLAGMGADPGSLVAAVGPSIGRCCYRVGGDVAESVARACRCRTEEIADPLDGAFMLDLGEANRMQLSGAGLPGHAVHVAPWCTSCRLDLFFSFRREGKAAGRMMAAISL